MPNSTKSAPTGSSHEPGGRADLRQPMEGLVGGPPHTPDQPMSVPLHLTSTYVAGGELEYGRYGNPPLGSLD